MKTVPRLLFPFLVLVAAALFMVSLSMGSMHFSALPVFIERLQGIHSAESVILLDIRLPRALLAVLVGATLGLAGAQMQGLLRNPLAEPGVLGVTGGAVLGAVLMLYTGLSASFALALPAGGMAGALLAVLILYFFSGFSPSVQTLILAGVALNTLAFAGTSLALNLTSNPYAAMEIVFWQMGSLANRSFDHVYLALPFILTGWILLLCNGRALNALSLGEDTARSLGVDMRTVRLRLVLGTALSVGAAVSVAGSIGFVGLIVPHLLRPFTGYEPARLAPVSAAGGAVLLLAADILVRLISSGTELKLGVLTAIVGAPFFIVILYQMRRRVV